LIALALASPLLGFALILSLQWFEEQVMTPDAVVVPMEPRG